MIEYYNEKTKEYNIQGRKGTIIGCHPSMLHLFELINHLANKPATTLLIGESGTGKELVAKAIHYNTKESNGDRPFVVMNCSAIPHSLFESILFGYLKGSYTDAKVDRYGMLHAADGGTLFLDEIGDMPFDLQPKLLRAIEEKTYTRVGDTEILKSDFRLLTGTNENLEEEVRKGNFRKDLWYRINVFPINLPPLREKKEDMEHLANWFVKMFNGQYKMRIPGLSTEALDRLKSYDWPGNVRELKNIIKRIFVISKDDRADKIGFEEININGDSKNSKLPSAHWYEDGVLPLPLIRFDGMGGAYPYFYLYDLFRRNKMKDVYFEHLEHGRIIAFLTHKNLQKFFKDKEHESYKTLYEKINNNPFNETAKNPFKVYTLTKLYEDAKMQGFDSMITCRRSLRDVASKSDNVLRIGEGVKGNLIYFVMTLDNLHMFLSPKSKKQKNANQNIEKIKQQIVDDYERFKSWVPES